MTRHKLGVPIARKTIVKATGIAGNVATTITVPTAERWKLLNIVIILTTDGTVANRYSRVSVRDSAATVKFRNEGAATPATTTRISYFNPAWQGGYAAYGALGLQLLDAAEDVVLDINGGVVGDAYDYLLEYVKIMM